MKRIYREAIRIAKEIGVEDVKLVRDGGAGHLRLCFTAGGRRASVALSCSPKNRDAALNMMGQALRRKLREMKV